MTLRALLVLGATFLGLACSEHDPTGITAGERMTVQEQVAIGSALEKAARALDSTHRPADELLADWIRIGSGLVSRQGQQGRLSVRVERRGTPITNLDMRGIAVRVIQGAVRVHLVLVWEGLDVVQLRANRVLVLVLTSDVEEGTSPPGSGEGRWIDFTTGAGFPDPYIARSISAQVSDGAFEGACPGVADTDQFTCTSGREALLVDSVVERGTEVIDVDWDAVVLPAFRIVGSVFP
jgi:hypothetical protein